MNKLIIILLLVACAQAEAGEFWTDDKVTNTLMMSANALLIADWAQTREIADNPKYKETGLAAYAIGSHPATKQVNSYFVGSLLVYNTLQYFLPTKYKRIHSAFVIGYEINHVGHNIEIGVSMKF